MELTGRAVVGVVLGLCFVIFGCSGVWADYPTSVIQDQPMGYWRLNETPGQPAINLGTAGDSLEGSYGGSWPGAEGPSELADGTPVLGLRNNVAFDVGSADAYVAVDASPLNGLTQFTLSGWVYIRELDVDRLGLFGQNDVVELGFDQPDQLRLWTSQGGSISWQFDPNSDLPHDAWFHVAAVGTGQSLELYLNGQNVQSGSTAIASDYGSSTFPFHIGGDVFDEGGNLFRGTLDEIAIWDVALSGEQIASHFAAALGSELAGDFDGNGQLEVNDVNLLQRAIYEGSLDLLYDVDANSVIDDDDLVFWIGDLAFTSIGDANLDGQFNSSDFVQVLATGHYEDDILENSTWDSGDWNADLEFNSADLVAALAYGGYELPGGNVRAIPEPTTFSTSYLAAVLFPLLFRSRPRPMAPSGL
jgi:hypothetical protein